MTAPRQSLHLHHWRLTRRVAAFKSEYPAGFIGICSKRGFGVKMLAFGPILWYKPRTKPGGPYLLKPDLWIDAFRGGGLIRSPNRKRHHSRDCIADLDDAPKPAFYQLTIAQH
jgi:hypothetical protein